MRGSSGRSLSVAAMLLAGGLAACQTPPTEAAEDFVAAANALARAEADYFDQIQAASDASFQLSNGFAYVDHNMQWKDLAPRLRRRNDFSKAKELRLIAIRQLQNYAFQIAAIATEGGDPSIADAAKVTVSEMAELGQNAGVLKISPSQLTLIETAVSDLAQAIVANQTARELRSLAQAASKPIAGIAGIIDADKAIIENSNYARELATDQTTALTAILSAVYADTRVNSAERMVIYSQYNMNWKPAVVTKGQDIADAMKRLQLANDAMKLNHRAAASTLAREAYQLAMQALATQPAKK